jgi:hypothetical protein
MIIPFPTEWKVINFLFQTTNQMFFTMEKWRFDLPNFKKILQLQVAQDCSSASPWKSPPKRCSWLRGGRTWAPTTSPSDRSKRSTCAGDLELGQDFNHEKMGKETQVFDAENGH